MAKDPAQEAAPPVAAPAPMLVLTAADAARQRELDALLRIQAKQDQARANSPPVEMVANVGFTIVSDEYPDGEEIKPGRHFTVPGFDVPSYLGKARLASDDAEATRGATVS